MFMQRLFQRGGRQNLSRSKYQSHTIFVNYLVIRHISACVVSTFSLVHKLCCRITMYKVCMPCKALLWYPGTKYKNGLEMWYLYKPIRALTINWTPGPTTSLKIGLGNMFPWLQIQFLPLDRHNLAGCRLIHFLLMKVTLYSQ